METPAACPIDGSSDKAQKVTDVMNTGPAWLRQQLKRPEIPPKPEQGPGQILAEQEAATRAWEASVHQAVAAQALWDSRLYYCYDHNVVFLAGESRFAPPGEAQSLLIAKSATAEPNTPQALPMQTPAVEQIPLVEGNDTDWEYCDIVARTSTFSVKYVAQAQGSRGMYEATPAQVVRTALASEDVGQKHGAAVYQMAQQLHANGWEYIGQGSQYWFHYRFRRHVDQHTSAMLKSPPTLPLPQPGATSQASGFSAQTATPTPTSLSDVASTARAWVREHISPEDEQRLKEAAERTARKAAEAAKGVGHAVKDVAVVAMAHAAISPATEAPSDAVPISETTTGFVLVDDDPVGSLKDNSQGSAHVLSDDIKDRLKAGAHYVAVDHAAHIRARQYGNYLDPSAGQRVKTVFTVAVEMLPGIPGEWYGLGDLITLIEGIMGRTMDGLRLSLLERMIYLLATVTPFVPARPVVGAYRRIEPWIRNEDTLENRAASAGMLYRATDKSGALMGAGWYFLLGQLPPWLRRSIPDIDDKRYPRTHSFRTRRMLTSFLWAPFVAYFAAAFVLAIGVTTRTGAQLSDLIAVDHLGYIFLLDKLLPPTQDQQFIVPGLLLLIALAFVGACVAGQRAYRDRVRESFVMTIRTKLGEAQHEVVGRVNDALWQAGSPISGKLTQSLKHIQDVSIKTAKGIVLSIVGKEALFIALAIVLAFVAAGGGVALAIALSVVGT